MENFIERCELAADQTGIEIIDTYQDGGSPSEFEDDGILHVIEGTTRVAFDVGEAQNLTAAQQNANTITILTILGRKVTSEALA